MSKKKKNIVTEELTKKNQIWDHQNYLESNSMDPTKFFVFQAKDFF